MKLNFLTIALFAFILFSACENENENETKISQNNTDESHNLGQNCMNCHVSGGDGEGWFTIAGSLYDNSKTVAYPNGSVKLTTEPNGSGTTKIIVANDIKGNFYTTEAIDFGEGLYAGVYGTNGEQKFMVSKITTGACNACHGNTTTKLWIE
jgi:cytochrome c553